MTGKKPLSPPARERGPLAKRLEDFLTLRNHDREKESGDYLLRVADVCDEVMRVGSISGVHMATILDGVSHPAALVNVNTMETVRTMQSKGFDIQPILMAMMASSKVGVRHLAVCCVQHETPSETTIAVLGAGLRDKASTVRARAARWAQQHIQGQCKSAMLSLVQAALAIEKNASALEDMEHAVKYIKIQMKARAKT